jgi:transposase
MASVRCAAVAHQETALHFPAGSRVEPCQRRCPRRGRSSALVTDLRQYGAALWTFANVEGLEPTNNAAERAIRKAVLWRKGSFGSASPAGSRSVERMLTVCESLRAQGLSILGFLVQSLRTRLAGQVRPSLLPTCSS